MIITVLILAAARYGAQTYDTLRTPKTEAAPTQTTEAYAPVPDAAKSTGKLFLVNWFYTAEKETIESKMKRLQPYISPHVAATIRAEDVLLMDPLTPNRVESWDDEDQWIEKGKKANLKYQVILDDGRSFLVAVKVVKSGQWMVDSLPGLIPEKPKKSPAEPSATIEGEKLAEVQSALDAFFPMWLTGKKEATIRFAADGAKIELDNILSQVEGSYEGVAISPVSEKPLQVRALVKLRSGEETLSFEYLITLTEQEGQVKIQSIQ